ncbi:ADP-ribosylation factor-like protein 2-binding protein [Atta colombica]|uniref:ADP-ribosylation factor-like protein 2-binding protein n=1 Tax=Atta colombica TaxID=520822 RepID=A0A195BB36_9HYME|nr:ADP-ribosylation factor-like protein 2-binding protein [Atta colombica]
MIDVKLSAVVHSRQNSKSLGGIAVLQNCRITDRRRSTSSPVSLARTILHSSRDIRRDTSPRTFVPIEGLAKRGSGGEGGDNDDNRGWVVRGWRADRAQQVAHEPSLSNPEDAKRISRSEEDRSFDEVIGHIEDLLLEEDFQALQNKFLEKYWDVFEPVEDNKLIYTDIFNEYNKAVEEYIVDYLKKVKPQFTVDTFLHQLKNNFGLLSNNFLILACLHNVIKLSEKQMELEGEVFEVLSTITDFLAFKEMFLDYRAVKEGKVADLSCGIAITSLKSYNSEDCKNPPR